MLTVNCHTDSTLDDKGRLALPKNVREAVDAAQIKELVLLFNGACILGFTREGYAEHILGPVRGVNFMDMASFGQFTHFTGTVNDVAIDNQGRIRIPNELRDRAGIDKSVHLGLTMSVFQVWDRSAWLRFLQQSGQGVPNRTEGPNTVAFPSPGAR